MKGLLKILAVSLAIMPLAAFAQNNNDKGWKAPGKTQTTTTKTTTATTRPAQRGWHAPTQPNRPARTVVTTTTTQSNTPPGWHRGRKTGWHGEDEPPGLEKREHDSFRRHHHHRRRDWERERHEHEHWREHREHERHEHDRH